MSLARGFPCNIPIPPPDHRVQGLGSAWPLMLQPGSPALPRDTAIERAEGIYRRLTQAHIDHGRKTCATGPYCCALLGEITLHEGRLPAFKQWYEKYMEAYKRFRALRAEMDMKVGPVLRSQLPVEC